MRPFTLTGLLLTFLFIPLLWFWSTTSEQTFWSTDLRHDLQEKVLTALEGAEKTIEISIYSLNDPHILQMLRRRADAGIRVKVLLDHKSTPYAKKKLGPRVETALYEGRGLMHHKIIVIDGKEVWLGSANLTPDSLKVHSNLMQRFSSEPLADYLRQKLSEMQTAGKVTPLPHKTFEIANKTIEFWFLPDNPKGADRIKELIASAKKSLRVAMYTFTRDDFCDCLVKQAKAGIRVEVIMDGGMCAGVCQKVSKALADSPVHVYKSEGAPLLHHKLMIIDDATLEFGSANWTKAAFANNDDYFLIESHLSPAEQEELANLWQALLKRSLSLSETKSFWQTGWEWLHTFYLKVIQVKTLVSALDEGPD